MTDFKQNERNEQTDDKQVTAGLVLIGNELLSGKVQDVNGSFLAQQLFEMGWHLKEIAVVPDCEEAIVSTVKRLSFQLDHLFTSGGIGPTHDDITIAAIACATGKSLVSSPVLEILLKKFYKVELLTPSQHRLSLVPEGAVLHYGENSSYPQMVIDNIYPLPGIPELFRQKFEELKELWPSAKPRLRRCINLIAQETDVAQILSEVAQAHPKVQLGSYPTFRERQWHLELVLESTDRLELDNTAEHLAKALDV